MALTYKNHEQRFGPVSIGTSSTNVVLAEIDLNGNDLLAGSSGDCVYYLTVWILAYNNNSSLYPMLWHYELGIQNRGGTYTVHSFELINTGSVGTWVVTINNTIVSTSLLRIRATNVDGTLTFSAVTFLTPGLMYNV